MASGLRAPAGESSSSTLRASAMAMSGRLTSEPATRTSTRPRPCQRMKGVWKTCTLWTLSRLMIQVRRLKKPRRATTVRGVTSQAWKRQSSQATGTARGTSTRAAQPQGRSRATRKADRNSARITRWDTARSRARGCAGRSSAVQGSTSATGTARLKITGSSPWSTMGTMPSAWRSWPSETPRPAVSMLTVP